LRPPSQQPVSTPIHLIEPRIPTIIDHFAGLLAREHVAKQLKQSQPRAGRTSGAEKFRSSAKKDFFNSIPLGADIDVGVRDFAGISIGPCWRISAASCGSEQTGSWLKHQTESL
jgi:hypothetical protein